MTNFTGNYASVNGIRLHYYRSTPAGSAPSIVMLHGVTDNGMCWVRVAEELSGDYDLILMDARGHGLSDAPDHGYALNDRAADVAGLIDTLGLDRPALIGHSMGAETAMATAALYPDKVRAAILEDPPFHQAQRENVTDEQLAERFSTWKAGLMHQKSMTREALIEELRQSNPNWHEDELGPWADSKLQMQGDLLVILSAIRGEWKDYLAKIQAPVMLVTGDNELGAIVSPALAEEAARLWQKGRVLHLPGAGHSIHRDQFEPYMREVKAFLAEAFKSA